MNDGTINLITKNLSPPLFVAANAEDVVYRNLCDPKHPHASKWKSFAEALWDEYRPFADKHFLIEVRRDFYARFWEMYLACALQRNALKHTYFLSCPKPGPDILIERNGRRIWIEAVIATDGDPNKPDSLKPPQLGKASQVPDERIVLRYTTAIESKHDAYLRYRSKGIVAEDDAYVIAVNGYPLSYRFADPEIPRILKVVFPIGSMQYVLDRKTGDVVTTRHQFRPNVYKSNGVDVSTRIFVDDRYRGISAVLHSYANPDMESADLGLDFLLVHNPMASQPLPNDVIVASSEYWAKWTDDHTEYELVRADG